VSGKRVTSPFAVDHVFVLCSAGASEAAVLTRAGLKEGSSNTHPGQGTACRRFFFENLYLELVWISDAEEARREPTARTRLWERWSERCRSACPFGLVFRSADGSASPEPPFPTWSYHPPYSEVAIDVGEETPLSEPALFYFRFARRPDALRGEPTAHALPLRKLTALSVGIPGPSARSEAARAAEATGLVSFPHADDHLMTLAFDGEAAGRAQDLRPVLPVLLAW
jgi:hypothetical protein